MVELKINDLVIILEAMDITKDGSEAIVNAANSSLMGGGGVDGAIHKAGGSAILEECMKIASMIGELPAGEAVVTTGGRLKSKYVIHTVGPVWHGGKSGEKELLRNAYYNSLKKGRELKIQSIAFPCISTGVYGYPKEEAALTAFTAVVDFIKNEKHYYKTVKFAVFGDKDFEIYKYLFDKYSA